MVDTYLGKLCISYRVHNSEENCTRWPHNSRYHWGKFGSIIISLILCTRAEYVASRLFADRISRLRDALFRHKSFNYKAGISQAIQEPIRNSIDRVFPNV